MADWLEKKLKQFQATENTHKTRTMTTKRE